jgi:hypothetical protein
VFGFEGRKRSVIALPFCFHSSQVPLHIATKIGLAAWDSGKTMHNLTQWWIIKQCRQAFCFGKHNAFERLLPANFTAFYEAFQNIFYCICYLVIGLWHSYWPAAESLW